MNLHESTKYHKYNVKCAALMEPPFMEIGMEMKLSHWGGDGDRGCAGAV